MTKPHTLDVVGFAESFWNCFLNYAAAEIAPGAFWNRAATLGGWQPCNRKNALSLVRRPRDLWEFWLMQKIASSIKFVGGFRLRELAERVVESQFGDAKGSKSIGFSHGDFRFVV